MLKPYTLAQIRFEEILEIGADGRNSRTCLVNDVQLGAEIVIKRVQKAKLNSPDEFFDEAKALYATSHPNVVQVHYACEDADHIYIAMPYYRSGSVKCLMAAEPLTIREIVRLGCQVLCGLHNIHSKGLIHFDIKPDNILLSDRGEALLSDFGLAKQMNLGVATPNGLYLRMAPPEATGGPPYDLRFDIYQVGLTLYRMCNGNDNFDEQCARFGSGASLDRLAFARELRSGTFPDRASFHEHIPAKLRKLIKKCLSPNPADRFQSALAVANCLAGVDDCLDWRLRKGTVSKVWSKNENGTEKRFTVNSDGSTELVSITNGRTRRTTNACRASMTRRDIEGILKGH